MKFRKIYFVILVIIALLTLTFILSIPKFNLENKVGEVNKDYIPVIKVYNVFHDFTNDVTMESDVDNSKIGKYKIKCKVKVLFLNFHKIFDVDIVDTEKPSIELNGNNPSLVCPNHLYNEEGYTAFDNYDGDITDKVSVFIQTDRILYSVIDNSNNKFEIERELVYNDVEKPSISLKGNNTITIYLGSKYNEPGYSAIDNCDGDITDKVKVSGNVDTTKIGNYVLKYEVNDSSGNTNEVERTIVVKKRIYTYGNGIIYLTFDDGPSYLTKQILDILEQENVKATFFVTSANEYTRQAYEVGHAIGLHSNTHKYSYIYSSSENYFNDLENISSNVYNVIGIRPTIIRFPGGSSNTVSRNYCQGIMSSLTAEVLNRGYIYFDWNVDSNDAGNDINNSQMIYYNVINNLSHNKTNVVLMHDSSGHKATVDALKDIIDFGKSNGYTFMPITKDTPIVIHSVNN